MFTGTGRFQFKEISTGLAEALFTAGKIDSNVVKQLSLQEAASLWAGGNEKFVELGFGSE